MVDTSVWESRALIRRTYEDVMPRLLARDGWLTPYFIDWSPIFTPIETLAWQAIRSQSIVPMYPQIPVGKWFIDFGNPLKKIGLEVDGKQWHETSRDRARDARLWEEHGWRIFRVTGSECYRVNDGLTVVDDVLAAMGALYFTDDCTADGFEILDGHRLCGFPLDA